MRRRQPKVYAEDPAYPANAVKQGVRTRIWLAGRIAPVLIADANRRGIAPTDPEAGETLKRVMDWTDAIIATANEVHP